MFQAVRRRRQEQGSAVPSNHGSKSRYIPCGPRLRGAQAAHSTAVQYQTLRFQQEVEFGNRSRFGWSVLQPVGPAKCRGVVEDWRSSCGICRHPSENQVPRAKEFPQVRTRFRKYTTLHILREDAFISWVFSENGSFG